MGNKPFTVGLSTDRGSYTAGQTINGTVFIAVQEGLREVPPATSLNITLVGTEYTVVHYRQSSDSSDRRDNAITEDNYEQSQHDIFRVEHAIVNFRPGQLQPGGRYEFPFALPLPCTLPSSFQGRSGQSHCALEYKLTAILRGAQGQQGFLWTQPPQASTTPIIRSSISKDDGLKTLTPIVVGEDDLPVRTCCGCCKGCCNFSWCRRSGHMDLHIQISPSLSMSSLPHVVIAARGTSVPVSLSARNRSTTKVTSIRIQLLQRLEWSAFARSASDERVVYSRNIPPESIGGDLEPLLHNPGRYSDTHYFGTPETAGLVAQSSIQNRMWHELGMCVIPHDALDTYAGCNIKVRHVLSVTLQTKGCCVTNPDMEVLCHIIGEGPVVEATAPPAAFDTLYSSDEKVQALPADWSAETADVVTIPMAHAELIQ